MSRDTPRSECIPNSRCRREFVGRDELAESCQRCRYKSNSRQHAFIISVMRTSDTRRETKLETSPDRFQHRLVFVPGSSGGVCGAGSRPDHTHTPDSECKQKSKGGPGGRKHDRFNSRIDGNQGSRAPQRAIFGRVTVENCNLSLLIRTSVVILPQRGKGPPRTHHIDIRQVLNLPCSTRRTACSRVFSFLREVRPSPDFSVVPNPPFHLDDPTPSEITYTLNRGCVSPVLNRHVMVCYLVINRPGSDYCDL